MNTGLLYQLVSIATIECLILGSPYDGVSVWEAIACNLILTGVALGIGIVDRLEDIQ